MKKAELGDYFLWNGELVRCEWTSEGQRTIGFKIKHKVVCPHCDKEHEITRGIDVIESSLMFQDNASPIKTISE